MKQFLKVWKALTGYCLEAALGISPPQVQLLASGALSQALTTEFRVLSWQQEGLREDMESLESMRMLHSNDVFIQSVLPG